MVVEMEKLLIIIKSGPEEIKQIEEAFRLAAAMIGFDEPAMILFIDEGMRCLQSGAFENSLLEDYLRAFSDLAGINAFSQENEVVLDNVDSNLKLNFLSQRDLVNYIENCKSTVTW